MRTYKYKYLTKEMIGILDDEIKKVGKDTLFEKVVHNIHAIAISRLQNEPGAFDEIYNGIWKTERWKIKYMQSFTIDKDSLEGEMLYYINKDRFIMSVKN